MGRSNERSRSGFSGDLTNAAMVRALFLGDVFIPKKQSIKVKVKLKSKEYQAAVEALLDSGSTNNFIDATIINRFKLPRIKLDRPRPIRNIDGSLNTVGMITHYVDLTIKYGTYEEKHNFFEIHLGTDDLVLGFPFLAATNPRINWKEGTFTGEVSAFTEDAHLHTPQRQQRTLNHQAIQAQNDNDYDEDYIPSNERGYMHMPPSYDMARRATMATQLAVQAADKRVRTWQEQVPLQYHKYGKVFSEIEAMRFPKPRIWDHAIDLLPDAPITMDCKIYPLAPLEQEAMNAFIKEQLDKGYI